MEKYLAVAKLVDIKEDSPTCAEFEGRSVSLFKIGNEYFATGGECTHVGGVLCQGKISNGEIICPLHGSKFRIKDGVVTNGPAIESLRVYKTRVNGENLELMVE